MSSEIFYTKAFIKVDDKYIPLINHGSSNCSIINYQGREVADKHWSVIRYPYEDCLIFTEDEMRVIARRHEEANTKNRGGTKKSQNKTFEVGEFERWFLGGLRYAYTVEDYTYFGNTVQVMDYDSRKRISVKTTAELLDTINSLSGHAIDIVFANDREVKHPRRRLTPQVLNGFEEREMYYVLKNSGGYFVRLTLNYVWSVPKINDQVRKFNSERQAKAYFRKFEKRLSCYGYQIECIKKASRANMTADNYQRLTDDEYNVLQKISSRTHMDEWFWLEESEDGSDYVRNLDDDSKMMLFDGISLLTEGMVSYELCDLSDEEIKVFEDLLKKLQIEAEIPRK